MSILQNTRLQKLTFSDAMAQGDRAIVPRNLIDECPFLRKALNRGDLYVLRIEIRNDVNIKTFGMHSPKSLGEQNLRWLELCQYHMTSRSFNLVINASSGDLEARSSGIADSWEMMHDFP
jgi:hypothetical protein